MFLQKTRQLAIIALVASLCMALLMLCGCNSAQQETYTSADQLAGKRIGYLTGTLNADYAMELAGDSGEAMGFNASSDLAVALESDKIDGYVQDEIGIFSLLEQFTDQKALDGYVVDFPYGAIFNKDSAKAEQLCKQFNEFLAKLKSAGELQELQDSWFRASDSLPEVELPGETGSNGTINVAVSGSTAGKPSTYYRNNKLTGWEIDLVTRFCNEYGYGAKFVDSDFSGVMAAVASNQCDFGLSCISITSEREKSYRFSDPYYEGGSVVVVKDYSAAANGGGFFEGLASSFQRTFIDESRWQLFASGVVSTLLISLLSILLGTLLGFVVYMLCRRFGKICNGFVNACVWLVSGMPTVVLLMVLFYIVFASLNISSTSVAVVAFTLVFASSVIGMLKVGVSAIDEGQTEAAKAMGYTSNQGFMRIILPQALRVVLPTFRSEAIGLLKATAVVGYIAVQDLTKMGDIVRSATYEAFFPLIAVAVIYFVLEGLLKLALDQISKQLEPSNRSEASILKGCQDASAQPVDHSSGDITVEFNHMGKDYGSVAPLTDVNAVVRSGDVVAVIGPSGCGKSTLLRALNLLDPPTSGKILLDGVDIMSHGKESHLINRKVGMVFQRWNLFAHWTVVENVMLPQVQLLGRSRAQAYVYAMELLESVGLASKAMSYPTELSGGQQQRVAIARTLAMDPDMILMDEPTSALDPEMVAEVQEVMMRLAATGRTMMIVTHDMSLAETVSNRVFFMDEGIVYEDGTSEQVFNDPHGVNTRRFINRQKTLLISAKAGSVDLSAVTEEIDAFCLRSRIPARTNMVMLLAFEEAVLNILSPNVPSASPIETELLYELKTGKGRMTARYKGDVIDPAKVDDGLPWKIVSGLASFTETRVCKTENYDHELVVGFGI